MRFFFIALLFPLICFADKAAFPGLEELKAPWFTGPLLASSALTIPVRHYNIEPYIFAVANTAVYDNDWESQPTKTLWNIYFQPLIQAGITRWLDFQITPTLFYNFIDGGGAKWVFGDLPVGIDIQIFHRGKKPTDYITAIKLELRETLPTGKYQNLNPKKLRTDIGGQGSWASSVQLDWGQLIHLWGKHFFDSRVTIQYTYFYPVSVKGFNFYGGGYGTKGKVKPGVNIEVDVGMEFTLTQNWVLAMDVVGTWSNRTKFKGKFGTLTDGTLAPIGGGSSAQFSLAPAIEYNWNANIGLIWGAWFTVAGRLTPQFASGVIAFNYYK